MDHTEKFEIYFLLIEEHMKHISNQSHLTGEEKAIRKLHLQNLRKLIVMVKDDCKP